MVNLFRLKVVKVTGFPTLLVITFDKGTTTSYGLNQ